MSEDGSRPAAPDDAKRAEDDGGRRRSSSRTRRPTRRLRFRSRVRERARSLVDRLLATDLVWSGSFVIVILGLLATQSCGIETRELEFGEVALEDLTSPIDFTYVDEVQTESRRREARETLAPVWVHDRARADAAAAALATVFELGRGALATQVESGGDGGDPRVDALPADVRRVLTARGFEADLERELLGALENVLDARIVSNKPSLVRHGRIALEQRPDGLRLELSTVDDFVDLGDARRALRTDVIDRLELRQADERTLAEFVETFVDSTVVFDSEATARAQHEAERDVESVLMRVRRGDVLIRAGDRVTTEIAAKIDAANAEVGPSFDAPAVLGYVFIASLFAFLIFRYTRYHQRAFKKLAHLHSLLVLLILGMLLLSRAMQWLAGEVVDTLLAPYDRIELYSYLIPLGAGAILVALLANGRIATVHAAFTSLLFGMLNQWNPYHMMWAMIVQCAGVYAISTYRERAALLRAGLVVGGVGAVSVMALEAVQGRPDGAASALYGAGLAFVGGAVGVGLVISFSLPLLERLFKVLTDIRLLELSNVNNPLLSELAMRAPGSYNHSLVVGTLAEEAARSIGANSLFCRVAAFYHDVGKMNKAEYYVENQRGINPHDRLTPSMSALIIASHVKDGIKMAREAGLPQQIIDIIPQHHGTKLMSYFYEKAKANADPGLGPVKEVDFRYPGPRPQTKEAAIFMLADGIEAAARTVEEPTANRLREMIRKVTNSIVLDNQLDECDLTFVDLTRIQQAFLRQLVSMYHHRVDYPGFDFNKPKGDRATAEPERKPEASGEPVAGWPQRRAVRGR